MKILPVRRDCRAVQDRQRTGLECKMETAPAYCGGRRCL